MPISTPELEAGEYKAPDISGIEHGLSTDFRITGVSLEFSGVCPRCQNERTIAQ